MTTTIQGTGMDLTPAIKQYAIEKIESLEKFFEGIVNADIDVGMRSNHHNKGNVYYAEVNLTVPKKDIIRVSKEAEDLYKAIDKVKDHLKVELEKIKGKMREIDRDELRGHKEYQG